MSYRIPPSMDEADGFLPVVRRGRLSEDTPEDRRVTSCAGKSVFRTAFGAHVSLQRLIARRAFKRHKGERMAPYRCQICHRWHIGGSLT